MAEFLLRSGDLSVGQKASAVDMAIGSAVHRRLQKKAKEAAKRAGKGKYRNDYQGRHYHPDGVPNYRTTPKGASAHDHYNYPRR